MDPRARHAITDMPRAAVSLSDALGRLQSHFSHNADRVRPGMIQSGPLPV
jgi:hypothetical protein